jgi:signal transduction histidine kinase
MTLTASFILTVLSLFLWWRVRVGRERAARVAHEVRGPLAAASLALHGAARRGDIPPRLLAALELELRRAALALDDLHGAPAPAAAPVDLADLLDRQVATWQEVAAARGATVALRPGPGAAVARADALRVAQATSNLVANAIEHGGGTVEVRTRVEGDRVFVEVADGGPGLPAPVASLVRRPRAGRGTRGRGLAIVAGIAARQGGRLLARPVPRGACLALELPAAS